MKIFVSWSGDLSNKIAIILKNWIPNIIQSVEIFVSSEDIEKGIRWNPEIDTQLSSSDFGILCLTKNNLGSQWLIFEAGALSNRFGMSKVCPLLYEIEVSEIAKPLQQFQAATFAKQDFYKLIRSINNSCGDNKLDVTRLEYLFNALWEDFFTQITEIKSETIINVKTSENSKIQNEAERKDIRERLNLFYHPAQSAFIVANKFLENPNDLDTWQKINSRKTGNEVQETSEFERACIYVGKELEKIANYRSLAEGDTLKAFSKFLYEEKSEENYLELSRLISRDIEDYERRLNE
jgi:hypothetical protein